MTGCKCSAHNEDECICGAWASSRQSREDEMKRAAYSDGFRAGQRLIKVRMAKYYDASAKPEEWRASLSNTILNFPIIEEPHL